LNSFRYRIPIFLFIIALLQCAWLSNLWAEDTNFEPNQNGKIGGWPTEFDGRYPVGTPPGDGWSFVSGDGQKFSSACIGKMRSPQCLVDTMMACGAWSDLDAGWPSETDAEEVFNHPICHALQNYPGKPGVGIATFTGPGFDPDNWMIYYKIDQRLVDRTWLIDPDLPYHLWGGNLFHLRPDDTAIIAFMVICETQSPLLSKNKTDDIPLYPRNNGPLSQCWDGTLEAEVLFARKRPDKEEWYVGNFFDVGQQGSSGKPWPKLDEWYAQVYPSVLPGMKSRF
jgi:hypothetical protein